MRVVSLAKLSSRTLIIVSIKWLLAFGVTLAVLWSLGVALDWTATPESWRATQTLFILALLIALVERKGWDWLSNRLRLPTILLHLLLIGLLTVALIAFIPPDNQDRLLILVTFILYNLLLLVISLLLRSRRWSDLGNLAITLISLLLALIVIEGIAPAATEAIAITRRQAAIDAALAAATFPLDQSELNGSTTEPPLVTRSPQSEVIEQGPGPEWGPLTGWGTTTNTVLRWWLDGVYEAQIEYNRLGFRGPEITRDKPDDVYRILLIGDSFIEAREVNDDDTIYAQLGSLLADSRTADGKRFEVFGVGATGWGTLQAYLYYHHEGIRFDPDLVIDFFFINDVADNHPTRFYPDRDIDFLIDDRSVQVLTEGAAPQESTSGPAARWLDALPPFLQNTNTAGLIRQIVAPPREAVTLAGALGAVHPQNYIFLRSPQIEGYGEGWRRTQRGYELWAGEIQDAGAQLMVVPIDISRERITEISTYFADQQEDWVWDVDLPTTRLAEILDPLGVALIATRDRYEAYAQSTGQRPYEALFYVEDGHWNPTGHRVTAELLAESLGEMGIIGG